MISLQRAREKIMNSSRNSKEEHQNYNNANQAQNDILNDENNSLFANSRPTSR
jgi:hypothetical protein